MNNNTVITISRQYGSGGRELSNILAKKLGIKLYDRQIINLAAEQLGIQDMDFDKMKKLEEAIPPLSLKFMPFYVFGMNGAKPINNKMFEAESKVVKQLSEDGSCIILGRCADYILRDREDCLKVFLYADEETKENRIQEIYGEAGLKLKNRVKDMDVRRGLNYKYFTGQDWGKAQNYDMALNRGSLGVEKCAQLIVEAALGE